MIVAIAEKSAQRSYGNTIGTIVAITIAGIKPGFHMIAAIAEKRSAMVWKHYRSDRDRWDRKNYISAIVAIVAIKWKPLWSIISQSAL